MYRITSKFLDKESFRSVPHNGYDFAMEKGETLRSIKEGIVRVVDYGDRLSGKTVLVEWEDGKTAVYGHLSEFAVKNGQHVNVGDILGYAGSTGFSTGNHLHFAIKEGGKFINPSPYIDHIQHMNDTQWLLTHTPKEELMIKTYSLVDLLKDQSDLYGSFFQSLKLQMIHLISSIDYSVFIHYLQHLLQFFS